MHGASCRSVWLMGIVAATPPFVELIPHPANKSLLAQPKLDEEQTEELREAFNLFDTDGSGTCGMQ